MTDGKKLKTKDVAAILGVSERTVIRWIERRSLPAYKPGRSYLFILREIQQWLERTKA
jgi:excisionase family DNA binding protein